jgi:hypothetical protein
MRILYFLRALRPLLLVSLTISVMIGMPRLVRVFRAPPAIPDQPSKVPGGPGAAQAPVPPVISPAAEPVRPAEPPQAIEVIPAALQPAQPPAVTEASSPLREEQASPPPAPLTEEELIQAIQKELIRLELYHGPVTGRWTRGARHAARLFVRSTGGHDRRPQPSPALLAALQAAKTAQRQSVAINVSPDEPPTRHTPAVPPAPATPPAKAESKPASRGEDYLPPWMTGRSSDAASAEGGETHQVPAGLDKAEQVHPRQRRAAGDGGARHRRRYYGGRGGFFGWF